MLLAVDVPEDYLSYFQRAQYHDIRSKDDGQAFHERTGNLAQMDTATPTLECWDSSGCRGNTRRRFVEKRTTFQTDTPGGCLRLLEVFGTP
jgi:hypothetical protein